MSYGNALEGAACGLAAYPKVNQQLVRLHTESIVDVHSKATPFRHFAIQPETDDDVEGEGTAVTFRFVAPSKREDGRSRNALPLGVLQSQLTTALKLRHPCGLILRSKEQSAVYPVVQFRYRMLEKMAGDEIAPIPGYTSHLCSYNEVRHIEPDGDPMVGGQQPQHRQFRSFHVILGFKTCGTRALLDSWKDWTGARYIYINFPPQLRLKKITLYRRERTEDANLFSYVVTVLCDGVDTDDKQRILLDFVQRLRAERTSNFVSFYEEVVT